MFLNAVITLSLSHPCNLALTTSFGKLLRNITKLFKVFFFEILEPKAYGGVRFFFFKDPKEEVFFA